MRHMRLILAGVILCSASARADDWPQWGRDATKNMVSPEKGLPSTFDPGRNKDGTEELDPSTTKNIRWIAKLGSAAYGNPTVAGGKVFVGTNNDNPRDPDVVGDYGIVMCLEEATGSLLWQLVVPKLGAGRVSDFDQVGICSSPAVDGDRVYLVTNRCEVICLDADGMADGNDGPFTDEAAYSGGNDAPAAKIKATSADIIWRYDMRDELGVFPHQMTASSVLVSGDRVYATTSNGRNWTTKHLPMPGAPALICLDKKTGELLGRENSGISSRTFLCNWSSPAMGNVGGKDVLFFGGGDGFCYAFDPVPQADASGLNVLKELWRVDCNPAERRKAKYNTPRGPSEVIATPVYHDGKVYASVGENPEHGDGDGCVTCIDATTGKIIWRNEKVGRSLSNFAVSDALAFTADYAGRVYCFDANTGAMNWEYDTEGQIWGSPLVADGKLYLGNDQSYFFVLAAAKEKRQISKIAMDAPIYSSTIAANGVLYVATENKLYAVKEGTR